MLTSLSVQNYALIQNLEINFNKGFSIITGETGAGKSILLGALGLILGQRADTNMLKNKKEKCIVEGIFNIQNYQLENFFKKHDLDYEDLSIIRRIINPNGKSRAFINDIPVNLNILKSLSSKLIDIHSQHQNLILNDRRFQLNVVDTYAQHTNLLQEYQTHFQNYHKILKKYKTLLQESKHNQAEEIKNHFSKTVAILKEDDKNILSLLEQPLDLLQKIQKYHPQTQPLSERLEATLIELQDITNEIQRYAENIEYDPDRLHEINERMSQLYTLLERHRVHTIPELIKIRDKLEKKLQMINSYDKVIEKL